MRIGLLNNLRAGRNRGSVSRLLGQLWRHPEIDHVETSTARAVPEALWELARRDVELLVINGGDGTLQYALTAILADGAFDGRVPMLAILRGGRTNMTALDLGTRRDPAQALEALVRAARERRIEERIRVRRALRVRLHAEREVRYGMFFGAGVIHRGIELVHRAFPQGSQGVFGASLVTGALLARSALLGNGQGLLAPDKIDLLVDRRSVGDGASRLVMATSLERLFLRMRPFWGRGPGGVRLTAVAAGARGLARALPALLAGREGAALREERGYLSRNAERVDLRLHCGLTVDGELVAPAPDRIVSITADDALRFVRA